MEDQKHLLEKVKSFVKEFFHSKDTSKYVYHNLKHTRDVADAVITIINHYQIADVDYIILVSAAWFHDAGYFVDPSQHEIKGAELAADFLRGENVDDAIIQKVKSCIMATKLPQNPHGLLEEILCDADLFHFGTDNFGKRNKLMHEEYNNTHTRQIGKAEWRDKTVAMLENHKYHTDYCRLLLNDQKARNISKLKNKKYEDENQPVMEENETQPGIIPVKDTDKRGNKNDRPEKGIETMFRISSNNHSRLSDMADNKAHILITVNSIILSAVISLVLRKLDNNTFLTVPSFILLCVSLVTIIFSILATRPTIPNGIFTQDDINAKSVNLLFFGNFYKMSLVDYRDAMIKVMNDHDFLYDNLIRDVYSQGIVLGKKYQLLRIAYNIFMFGLTISVIAFIIASATSQTGHHGPVALNLFFQQIGL